MKTNKDFNLSKSAKRRLATMSTEKASLWKPLFIESEVAEKHAKMAKIKERSNTNQGEA
jgi:hypothetical protein